MCAASAVTPARTSATNGSSVRGSRRGARVAEVGSSRHGTTYFFVAVFVTVFATFLPAAFTAALEDALAGGAPATL